MDSWSPALVVAQAYEALVRGRTPVRVRERTLPVSGNGGHPFLGTDCFDNPIDDVRRVAACVKHGRRR